MTPTGRSAGLGGSRRVPHHLSRTRCHGDHSDRATAVRRISAIHEVTAIVPLSPIAGRWGACHRSGVSVHGSSWTPMECSAWSGGMPATYARVRCCQHLSRVVDGRCAQIVRQSPCEVHRSRWWLAYPSGKTIRLWTPRAAEAAAGLTHAAGRAARRVKAAGAPVRAEAVTGARGHVATALILLAGCAIRMRRPVTGAPEEVANRLMGELPGVPSAPFFIRQG